MNVRHVSQVSCYRTINISVTCITDSLLLCIIYSDGKDVGSSVVGDGDAEMTKDEKPKSNQNKPEPLATQVLTGGKQIELNIPLDDSMDSSRSSHQLSTGRSTARSRRPTSERKTATLTSPKFGPFSG